MDNYLFEHILDLKINEVKMHINLKVDEKVYYTDEIKAIYKTLNLDDVKQLENLTKHKLVKTKDILEGCKNLNKVTVKDKHKVTMFDAKTFYDFSTKKLACEELLQDCAELKDKLLDKELQF